uniref:Uncharacterized protein n=1 Tax=Tetraselmis sp. GSL018 TaxID=582737 RepID=A0A061RZ88_9CHLO
MPVNSAHTSTEDCPKLKYIDRIRHVYRD